ncbi:MAG: hypothetical protein A2Y40_08005 [Candidatus Margulisbacteria bacterium GWF2_35_9]|nr:MAG: hypothetical protein A2Y40_08005 [Candidatus Margulisbacteria bacterium GWF2_35_9]
MTLQICKDYKLKLQICTQKTKGIQKCKIIPWLVLINILETNEKISKSNVKLVWQYICKQWVME